MRTAGRRQGARPLVTFGNHRRPPTRTRDAWPAPGFKVSSLLHLFIALSSLGCAWTEVVQPSFSEISTVLGACLLSLASGGPPSTCPSGLDGPQRLSNTIKTAAGKQSASTSLAPK